ncbi:MAG: heme exporter protein CcmD [Moraxella sp.]|nr:heme exporter protein CcmD [Moraxella sp.]
MSPYFATIYDFVHMGGHASYVWACYGITFGCLLLLIWYAKNERKAMLNKLSRQPKRPKLTNKQRKQLSI